MLTGGRQYLNGRKRCQRLGSRQSGKSGPTRDHSTQEGCQKRVQRNKRQTRLQSCAESDPHREGLSNIIGRIQRQLKNSTPSHNCQAQDFMTFLVLNFFKKIRAVVGEIMAPQICPCPNLQNLWILPFGAKGFFFQ